MGLLKIVDRFEDLCDQVGHVDLKCPIQKGSMTIVKTVSMPNFIPRVCDISGVDEGGDY